METQLLAVLAGLASMFTPPPVVTEVTVLSWVMGGCFIGLLLVLVYGTRRDVVDREQIFARIIRARQKEEGFS